MESDPRARLEGCAAPAGARPLSNALVRLRLAEAEGTLYEWLVSDFSVYDAFESGLVKVVRLPTQTSRGTCIWTCGIS